VGEEDAHGLRPIRIAPMKRSFIDARIEAMLALCERHGVRLPPFAQWSERDFRADRDAAGFIAACGLGWNVVEFKPGAFATDGLTLFTLRMGDWRQLEARGGRLYAEKAIMSQDGQRAPHHYHVVKTEDIVNRGGARFVVELFKVDRTGQPVKERFRALKDVTMLDLGPGDQVRLEPGESLTLEPYVAHAFWAEGGAAIAGEVSLVNDDRSDNYFVPMLEPPRPIEEDAPARRLTVRDYERL
jgi:D-lyxose ketol-isomerase